MQQAAMGLRKVRGTPATVRSSDTSSEAELEEPRALWLRFRNSFARAAAMLRRLGGMLLPPGKDAAFPGSVHAAVSTLHACAGQPMDGACLQ